MHSNKHIAFTLLSPLALVIGCAEVSAPSGAGTGEVAQSTQEVVYFEDDRMEAYAHPSEVARDTAYSVAAMISNTRIDASDPDNVVLRSSETLGEGEDLCDTERFFDQPKTSVCSGTLIADNVIVTAGHCVDEEDNCTDRSWVFGYEYASEGVLGTVTADDVYTCARVIEWVDDDEFGDWGLIELDRPVVGRTPVPVRSVDSPLELGEATTLIGFPSGIPMKIDTGGAVVQTAYAGNLVDFRTTNDAFAGNSGSGVFDDAGNMIGILSGGGRDYVSNRGCNIVNVEEAPETSQDSEVSTYIARAVEGLCATGYEGALCDAPLTMPPRPAGDTCETAIPLEFRTQEAAFLLSDFRDDYAGSCRDDAGPDAVYEFTADEDVTVDFASIGSGVTFYVRTACDGEDLVCEHRINSVIGGVHESLQVVAGQRYFLFVDWWSVDIQPASILMIVDGEVPGEDGGSGGGGEDGGDDGGGALGCSASGTGSARGLLGLPLFGLFLLRRRSRRA